MRVTVSTAPTEEPLTLAEVKEHLRVEHTADDSYLLACLFAARDLIQEETGRSLTTRTLQVFLTATEAAPPVVLPYGPVASVTSYSAWSDAADDYAAAASTAYQLAGDRLAVSQEGDATAWPTFDRYEDAVRVTYVAGYGTALQVPEALKVAILALVGLWYEDRSQFGAMSDGARTAAAPYVNYAVY